MSWRSRIAVTDFVCTTSDVVVVSMPERFSPNLHHIGHRSRRTEHGKDLFEVDKLHGRKFAVTGGTDPGSGAKKMRIEALPQDQELTGRLLLYNVHPWEMGGLLATLGVDPASALKLGGGKAHGFGRVRCRRLDWNLRDSQGDAIEPDLAAWRRAFCQAAARWADGEDTLVAIHRGGC